MSSPPPSYPGYPAYSAGGSPAPSRLRGRRAIQVGIVLLVVGLAAMVVGGFVLATRSLAKVQDFQRISVSAGSGTVTFSRPGGYVAYYESSTVTSATTVVPAVGVLLTGPTGAELIVDVPYGGRSDNKITSLKYDVDGRRGVALYQFRIDTPGIYQVRLVPNSLDAPDAGIAFGKSIARGTVAGALSIALGLLLMLAGLITLIIGLVRRSRHKSLLTAGAYYGGHPAASPWPGQQQWAPKPWPGAPTPPVQQPWPGAPTPPVQQPWPGAPIPPVQHPWPPAEAPRPDPPTHGSPPA